MKMLLCFGLGFLLGIVFIIVLTLALSQKGDDNAL